MEFSKQEYWSGLPFPSPDQPRKHIKKQRPYFANKGPSSQSYGFSSSHVWVWEWDYKESWAPRKWCFWTVVLESRLDHKEIQPVHPKGNQSWIFTGMTDAEAEAPILWPPDAKSQCPGKDPDSGKDWRQEEKGMTEGEMVGWYQPIRWTWVWASSGSWWRTGKLGVLQSMGFLKVGHDWMTELNLVYTIQAGTLCVHEAWMHVKVTHIEWGAFMASIRKNQIQSICQ